MPRLLTDPMTGAVDIGALSVRPASELQALLYWAYPGVPDGIIGPLTAATYRDTKQSFGMSADLILDAAMLARLKYEFAQRYRVQSETPIDVHTLQFTAEGGWLQVCLSARYVGAIDAVIGPLTVAAYHAFQRANELAISNDIDATVAQTLADEFGPAPT